MIETKHQHYLAKHEYLFLSKMGKRLANLTKIFEEHIGLEEYSPCDIEYLQDLTKTKDALESITVILEGLQFHFEGVIQSFSSKNMPSFQSKEIQYELFNNPHTRLENA